MGEQLVALDELVDRLAQQLGDPPGRLWAEVGPAAPLCAGQLRAARQARRSSRTRAQQRRDTVQLAGG